MKKGTATAQNRRILLQVAVEPGALRGSDLPPDPIFQPINGSSQTTTIRRIPKQPSSPLDSSMVLTILVLVTAFFFMGFFSIFIRRFSEEDSTDIRRRRHPSRQPPPGWDDNRKSPGADPTTVKSLPLVSYCGGAKQLITDCPICLSEFEEREIVKLIPSCRHVFHPTCLDTWLASHVSCPLCRSSQFFKAVDDEVRLDVAEEEEEEEENGDGVSELDGRSTAGDGDTSRDVGMRRVCSCTSLGDRLVLQRSMSF